MKEPFSKLKSEFPEKEKKKKEEIKTIWTPGTNFGPEKKTSPQPI
jgi:hypothetical protein